MHIPQLIESEFMLSSCHPMLRLNYMYIIGSTHDFNAICVPKHGATALEGYNYLEPSSK